MSWRPGASQRSRRSRTRSEEQEQESLPVPTDVSNKSEVESMVKQALDRFGKVDILVNNAGVAIHNPIP